MTTSITTTTATTTTLPPHPPVRRVVNSSLRDGKPPRVSPTSPAWMSDSTGGAPRPPLVATLNNKGVEFLQRQQYEQAHQSFSKALLLLQQEQQQSPPLAPTRHKKPKATEERHSSPELELGLSLQCSLEPLVLPDTSSSPRRVQTTATAIKHRAEYDEGMGVFQAPLQLGQSSYSDDTNSNQHPRGIRNEPATILFNLARVYHQQDHLDQALGCYRRALVSLHDDSHHNDIYLTLAILFGIGHIQYMRGDHADSLQTYRTSLRLARTLGKESVPVAACLNCIGVLHYVMHDGDVATALESLQTSIRIRTSQLGKLHADVGTTWNNLGRVYFQQGRYGPAMKAYRQSLAIRRSAHGDSVDVAATLFNIGQCYHQEGHKDKALRHYQEFLKLATHYFGKAHRDICIVTTCIGQVLHEQKEFNKALKAFRQALRVGRAALGTVHAEIAITLNKLGNLHYETGDLDGALKAYHQGLRVELAVLEPGNPNVCVTYTNIAEIHKQRGEFAQALTHYDKVLRLQRRHSCDPLEIANTLSSIGYVRHQKGDYQRAMDVNQECLRIRREIKGDVDEEVASTLTHIALVLLKLESHDMALQVLSEAYRIRSLLSNGRSSGANTEAKPTRDIAFTLYNIALIHHQQGSHEQALQFYLETARVEKAALGEAHRDLSITAYNIAQVYYQRGDMDLAVDYFTEALRIERLCFGPDHVTCARTLNEIGNIELQRGNLDAMLGCYTQALRIYRHHHGAVGDEHLVIYGRSLWRFEVVQPAAAGMA